MTCFMQIQREFISRSQSRDIDQEFDTNFLVTSLYFAQLAYFHPSYVYKRLEQLGAKTSSIYNKNQVQAVFAEFDNTVVIAFKGRERHTWQEISIDLKFWKRKHSGHHVHTGFSGSLENVSRRLLLDLKDVIGNKRVIYTGHSLGGALATLMALEHKPTDVCTFGSPRVINSKFDEDYFADVNITRVCTDRDFVTHLPPSFTGYKHVGTQYEIPGVEGRWESHKLRTYISSVLHDDLLMSEGFDTDEEIERHLYNLQPSALASVTEVENDE